MLLSPGQRPGAVGGPPIGASVRPAGARASAVAARGQDERDGVPREKFPSDVSPALLGELEDGAGVQTVCALGSAVPGLVVAAYGSDLATRMHDELAVMDAVRSERAGS